MKNILCSVYTQTPFLTYGFFSHLFVAVTQLQPACSQIFNLFYLSDPSASRLEPLLHSCFHQLPPFPVPRYHCYPLGDGCSTLIGEGEMILYPSYWLFKTSSIITWVKHCHQIYFNTIYFLCAAYVTTYIKFWLKSRQAEFYKHMHKMYLPAV